MRWPGSFSITYPPADLPTVADDRVRTVNGCADRNQSRGTDELYSPCPACGHQHAPTSAGGGDFCPWCAVSVLRDRVAHLERQ